VAPGRNVDGVWVALRAMSRAATWAGAGEAVATHVAMAMEMERRVLISVIVRGSYRPLGGEY